MTQPTNQRLDQAAASRQARRGWGVGLASWAIGALLLSAWQVGRFIESEHASFSAAFDKAFDAVAQRLDQNEALLDGLVALLRSSRAGEFPELRQYANEMLARYPHLYTVGYQPRVNLAQRDAFEQRIRQHTGRAFRIRDFSLAGSRTWREATPRPFYYPVTFMAPDLPEAQDIIGYDVYEDRQFRDAIKHSTRFDEPVASMPFDLVEGGRGYTYFRALHATAAGLTDHNAPADHLISLLIRADRLLANAAAPRGGWIELRHRGAHGSAPLLLARLGGLPSQAATWALPELRLQRSMRSTRQPFDMELSARPQWQDFAPRWWLLWLAAWTALCGAGQAIRLVIQRAQRLRAHAQDQAVQARQDLAAAGRRAEVSRARNLDELGLGIAHELNQPLTAVVGYSQAALRLLGSSTAPSAAQLDQVREALLANTQQALRAGELMQRLRTLVRRQPVQFRALEMQAVLGNALRIEAERIESAGVRVETRAPQDGVTLFGDAMLLEQLLANLLRNALDALSAQAQPRVDIQLAVIDGQCRLTVADNGCGMSAEQLARAFHPFQSTKPEGIGIGLVVCAAIVQAHGGDIGAESPADGGARFTVTLPLTPAQDALP
jgi:signal transduction histidine kinase